MNPLKESHPYKGTISVCLSCFKPKSDKLHQSSVDESKLESRISPSCLDSKPPKLQAHSHTCTVCTAVLLHSNEDEILACNIRNPYVCGACFHLSSEDKEYASWAQFAVPEKIKTICVGHTCPKCGNAWQHDYMCGKGTEYKPLCPDCATQSTANIFRPVQIEQIAQTASQVLTGQEHKELELQNENMVWLMCHDAITKQLLPDWQEKIHNHRRQQQRLIESIRVRELSTKKCEVDYQSEEMQYLTPEERETYERDARRGRTVNGRVPKKDKSGSSTASVSGAASSQETAKVAHAKLLKGLMDQIKTRKPKLTEDELLLAAEKRYQAMKEEDE